MIKKFKFFAVAIMAVVVMLSCDKDEDPEPEVQINYGSFTDLRDNMTYKTVEIGNQVWMAENLKYAPGSGNYLAYDENQSNVSEYGYLYDWQTAQAVSPAGWHLPTETEWEILINFLGGDEKAAAKLKTTSGWDWIAKNGTNESGFSAKPSGQGSFWGSTTVSSFIEMHAYFWTSTRVNSEESMEYRLGVGDVCNFSSYTNYANSVRCIKD